MSLAQDGNTTREGSTHRIVVGIDGSPSSAAALEWAVLQAERTGTTLEALMSWEWPQSYGGVAFLASDYDPDSDAHAMLDEALKGARATHPDVTIQPIVVESHPAPALVEASRGADLLVVGCRGRGEFAGMLLGSVSGHCVHHALCPITVVR